LGTSNFQRCLYGRIAACCRGTDVVRVRAYRWLRYKCRHGQTCEDCYRDGRDSVWLHVPNDVWDAVRGDRHVLCLTCFDRRAERMGVDYSGDVVVMGREAWLACGVAAKALEARQVSGWAAQSSYLSDT
jgi:hypothetical protein